MRVHRWIFLFAVVAVALLAVAGRAADTTIHVGMIPDAGATQVAVDQKKPLADYLQRTLGQPVQLVIPANYNATVEALGNDSWILPISVG
jgi:phosphonate transport system substrate-binding protein